jgi:hypothetical protein
LKLRQGFATLLVLGACPALAGCGHTRPPHFAALRAHNAGIASAIGLPSGAHQVKRRQYELMSDEGARVEQHGRAPTVGVETYVEARSDSSDGQALADYFARWLTSRGFSVDTFDRAAHGLTGGVELDATHATDDVHVSVDVVRDKTLRPVARSDARIVVSVKSAPVR